MKNRRDSKAEDKRHGRATSIAQPRWLHTAVSGRRCPGLPARLAGNGCPSGRHGPSRSFLRWLEARACPQQKGFHTIFFCLLQMLGLTKPYQTCLCFSCESPFDRENQGKSRSCGYLVRLELEAHQSPQTFWLPIVHKHCIFKSFLLYLFCSGAS